MSKVYGVLLIGCGHIGNQHIADIYDKPEAKFIAAVDADAARAQECAKTYGALASGTDYRPFLSDPRVDVVIIATYTDTHLSILRDCLAHHKHVICEKPIATNLEDATEFVRLVKQSDCKVAVSYVLRYNKSYRMIKSLIDGGEIGQLRMVRMNQSHHAGEEGHSWERLRRLMQDCPPLIDCGVHYADVMHWFTGSKIVSVSGISAKLDDDAPRDNYQMMAMETANGCRGYYEVGWSRNLAANNDKDFIGTKGHITLTMAANRQDGVTDRDLISVFYGDGRETKRIELSSVYKDMYAQFRSLLDMVENGGEGVVPIDDVYDAFRTVVLANQAIRDGKRICL